MDPVQYPQHEINSSQHQPYPGLDIDAVLSVRMNDMALKYEAQLNLFKSSLQDQFITATQQSEIENGHLREELARLQAFQRLISKWVKPQASTSTNALMTLVHVRVQPSPPPRTLGLPQVR
ncbi:hypothetical protein B0H10DRAFT_1949983 [Mycena sp. CBHHK59/15]|nr:hypothetical protein B0H10DRAFT_1949983 [Mycena sp. CBHHK59/15]